MALAGVSTQCLPIQPVTTLGMMSSFIEKLFISSSDNDVG